MPSVARHLRKLCILGLLASPAHAADDWQAVSFISETVGNHSNRLCMGVPDHMRGSDIGCPTYAPSLTTGGHVSITGNVSANRFIGDGSGLTNLNVQGDRIVSGTHGAIINEGTGTISLTTGGVPWGYFSAGWSRLANLFADTVSSTVVSATNVSATYVDAARGGTVSGTYGYFRHISSTYLSGDGSGLYNVPASAVSGLNLDRITSGSHAVIANQGTGYVSLTTGGTTWGYLSAGWSRLANLFADTVSSTLVSATNVSATYVDATRGGTVSGTYGYFHHISGTYSGDGSGLYNVPASAVSGLNLDRITSGSHAVIANQNTGYVSLTTGGSTWGYLSAGWSRLANLFADTVSSTLVSATNVSATSVDTTRGGTVSGTYGYFRFISGTDIHGRFSGDGSGLTGVTAAASDRIVSGSTGGTRMVAISNTGYISITQAGANSGWFDPTRGLVTLGVSATGAISATRGYFSGNVGIGAFPNNNALYISGNVARIAADDYAQWSASSNGVNVFYGANGNTGRAYLGTTSNHGLRIYANNQTRMSIAANGNVGISTTDPLAKLDVVGTISASDAIQVGNSGLACSPGIAGALRYSGSKIEFCNGVAWGALVGAADAMGDRIVSGTTNIIANQDGSLTFTTSNNLRMLVGSDGRVGIGTTTPTLALDVDGGIAVRNASSNAQINFYSQGSPANRIQFYASGVRQYRINHAPADSSFNIYSDILSSNVVVVSASGNVGIKQGTPTATLDVVGTISASNAIQVGTSALMCGAGIPGAIRYQGTSLQFCNGTSWTTLGSAGAATAASSTGAVQFNAGGSLGGDTTNFFWDNAAKRLAIGGGLPLSGTLHLRGQAGTHALYVESGSGSYLSTPMFAVNSSAVGNTAAAWGLGMVNTNTTNNNRLRLGFYTHDLGGNISIAGEIQTVFRNRTVNGFEADMLFMTRNTNSTNTEMMRITSAGNVGVGTPSPTATLQVSGSFIVSTSTQLTTPSLYVGADGRVGIGGMPNAARMATFGDFLNGDMTLLADLRPSFRADATGTYHYIGSAIQPSIDFADGTTNSGYVQAQTISTFRRNIGGDAGTLASLIGQRMVYGHYQANASTRHTNLVKGIELGGYAQNGTIGSMHALYIRPLAGTNVEKSWGIYQQGGSEQNYFAGRIGVGSGRSEPSATLDVAGTISASGAIQVGTSSLTCGAGIPGAIRYNAPNLQFCNGTSWTNIGGSGGGGQEDRIVSGTHAVTVNEDFGLVSLSTGETTWGYLNSTRSYLPALSSVQVSSTNVSATLLQVGTGNGAACDVSRRGAMRYSTVSSTVEYCQGSAWVSMGPSATAVPSFRAFLSAAQSIPENTNTKVNLDTIDFDTYNNFDTGNGSFTPTVPGTYVLTANATYSSLSANQYAYLFIRKNGSIVSQIHFRAGSSNDHAGRAITAIVQANGTTDSFDIAVRHSASSAASLYSNHNMTSFSGALISMAGGGGSGGGGATALDDLTDVNTSGVVTGSILAYDGSTWVVSSSGVSGDNALGDRITSGTHAVTVNQSSGYVSLSTAGTDWGYLSGGLSYLPFIHAPTVSSTHVRATTISGTLIQVGNSEQACVAGIAGAIRYESDHLEYCNGSSWTPLGAGINPVLASVNFQGTGTVTIRNQHNVASITDNGTGDYTLHFSQPLPSTDYIVLTNASRDGANGGVSGNILEGSQTSTTVRVQFRTASGGSARDPEYAFVSILPADNVLVGEPGGGGASALSELSDVNTSGASTGSILAYNGSSWVVSETTGSSALGDRLTSGTHAVTVNTSSGYVSLSTNDTTWGYFNSGNSYLPQLTANRVSATNISATHIQLSSPTTVLACDSGLTGAMRYTSGTMQVCNGTEWGNIGLGVPTGTIAAFATASCPSGWTEYAPSRGRFLRGIDTLAAGIDPSGTRAPGHIQEDAFQSHTHYTGVQNNDNADYTSSFANQGYVTGAGFGGRRVTGDNTGPTRFAVTSSPLSGGQTVDGAKESLNTSANLADETRPKNVAVTYCMYAGFESAVAAGITTLGGLSDVAVGGATPGQALIFDGASWIASTTTGGSSALGDRITSGTHAVTVNEDSGLVSLSTGETTWGYLGSGNSYLPQLTANRVSATTISATLVDVMGQVRGNAADAVGAPTYSWSGNLDTGMYLAASNQIGFSTGGTQRLLLTSSGATAEAFLYSSDARLKQNVTAMTGGLAKVDALNPVTFHYTADARKRDRLGFLAQDVEKVFPQAVVTGKDGMKSVDYPSLVPALVGALKELKAEMAADAAGHAQRIRELEAANDNLKAANADILRRLEHLESRKAATQ